MKMFAPAWMVVSLLALTPACSKDKPADPAPAPTVATPSPAEPAKAPPTIAPAEPKPAEPVPTEPKPVEPAPAEPTPAEPTPTPAEPAPTEPAPTEPAPTEPAPTEPAPTETGDAPDDGAEKMYEVNMVAAQLTTAIVDRMPSEVRSNWVIGQDPEFLIWMEFNNPGDEFELVTVWKKDGAEKWRFPFKVGKSKNWRTWVTKRIGKRDAGSWTIDIVDEGGYVYKSVPFTISEG